MIMRKIQSVTVVILTIAVFVTCLTVCAKANGELLSKMAFVTDISGLSVNENIRIVGLGEASHGTSEFQQLKGDVFKALAANNECRVFAVEGDFGGCAKVNEYIHGGDGTAQEAVAQIGFRIYRTQEMSDIVEWMRKYNETAPDGKDLKFYGFDAQRYNNNKELLFEYLTVYMPVLAQEYMLKLSSLTDEDMYSLDKTTLAQAINDISSLISEMEAERPSALDEAKRFEMALEYAQCILENTLLRGESADYSKMRDALMAKKVEWIAQHEEGLIYVNGHNGHIGKQSVSGYTCMGELLDEKYGDSYFTIGTDAESTKFNALDGDIYKEFNVVNKNTFTEQLDGTDENFYYLEFSKVSQDERWRQILTTQQQMTALNVDFSNIKKVSKLFYTLTVTPAEAYDGIIVIKSTVPTNLLE